MVSLKSGVGPSKYCGIKLTLIIIKDLVQNNQLNPKSVHKSRIKSESRKEDLIVHF